jgi:hypothetical protein
MKPSETDARASILAFSFTNAACVPLLFALAGLCVPAPGLATCFVAPDGSGEYPTIQAAVDASPDGDLIILGDGVFHGDGNRDINISQKGVILQSSSGHPEACVIDAEGTESDPHRIFEISASSVSMSLLHLTMRGGWTAEPGGAAVLCDSSGTVMLVDCVLEGNHGAAIHCEEAAVTVQSCSIRQNQAIYGAGISSLNGSLVVSYTSFSDNQAESGGAVHGDFTHAVFMDCSFDANVAQASPALDFRESTTAEVVRCMFTQNEESGLFGVVTLFLSCQGSFERCTFAGNRAPSGTVLYSQKISNTTITNCTFWGNDAGQGAVWAGSEQCSLDNTLIASTHIGPAVQSPYEHATLTCCDLWGNEGGDWVGTIEGQLGINGNIAADPRLCAPDAGDFTLAGNSPCAPFTPPNPECDLIGAWPVGCAATPVVTTTWGALKARFR